MNQINSLKKIRAYSLLEMMLVIALIGILIGIATPMYKNHTQKAYFTEIVQSAIPFQSAVIHCYHLAGSLTPCSSGKRNIPTFKSKNHNTVSSIRVKRGTITVTPKQTHGFSSEDTYILTPHISHHNLFWKKSGGAQKKGFINK